MKQFSRITLLVQSFCSWEQNTHSKALQKKRTS